MYHPTSILIGQLV